MDKLCHMLLVRSVKILIWKNMFAAKHKALDNMCVVCVCVCVCVQLKKMYQVQ